MQHYLVNSDSAGSYSAAALMSASGFDVDFMANAGQQVSVSAQPTQSYGTSPLSITIYDPNGAMVYASQPYGVSYGYGSTGAGAEFVAQQGGLYTATIQNSGQFTKAQSVSVSVTEAGLPPTYLSYLHPEQAGPAPFSWADTMTHQAGTTNGQAYNGGVNYLQNQYLWSGQDSVNVSTSLANVFIRGGPGNDALAAQAGSNVVDGGTGSNFLVGSASTDGGQDTFFLDGRGNATTWDTLANFHAGDAVTLWGFVPGQSAMNWAASDGSGGYTGATIHAATAGAGTAVNASVTFAGVSLADAQSKFLLSSGTAGGIPYLYVHYSG